jgi:hypothetical protein
VAGYFIIGVLVAIANGMVMNYRGFMPGLSAFGGFWAPGWSKLLFIPYMFGMHAVAWPVSLWLTYMELVHPKTQDH